MYFFFLCVQPCVHLCGMCASLWNCDWKTIVFHRKLYIWTSNEHYKSVRPRNLRKHDFTTYLLERPLLRSRCFKCCQGRQTATFCNRAVEDKKTRFFSIFWWTFQTAWKCWMWKCFKLCDAQTPAHSFLLLAAALEDVQISHWEWCKPPQVWLMFSESICEIHQMKAIWFSLVKLDIQVNALPGKQINRSHFPVVSC